MGRYTSAQAVFTQPGRVGPCCAPPGRDWVRMMLASFLLLCGGGLLFGVAERVPGLTGSGLALLCGAYPALLQLVALQRQTVNSAGPVLGQVAVPDQFAHAQPGASAVERARAAPGGRAGLPALLALCLFVLAALAGMWLGAWLELPTLSVWSPQLAGVLFAAVAAVLCVRLLRLGSALPVAALLLPVGAAFAFALMLIEPPGDTPGVLSGALNAMIAGTASLLPGVPVERAVVVSGTLAVFEALFGGGPGWTLLLMALATLMLGAAVSFAQSCLTLLTRFPVATEMLLLSILMGGATRLWPWQVVSTYTLTRGGAQLALSSKPVTPAAYVLHTGAPAHAVEVLLMMTLAAVLTTALLRDQRVQRRLARMLEPWRGDLSRRERSASARVQLDGRG